MSSVGPHTAISKAAQIEGFTKGFDQFRAQVHGKNLSSEEIAARWDDFGGVSHRKQRLRGGKDRGKRN